EKFDSRLGLGHCTSPSMAAPATAPQHFPFQFGARPRTPRPMIPPHHILRRCSAYQGIRCKPRGRSKFSEVVPSRNEAPIAVRVGVALARLHAISCDRPFVRFGERLYNGPNLSGIGRCGAETWGAATIFSWL